MGQALCVFVAAEMEVWKLIGQQAGRAEWRTGTGSKRGRAGTTSYDAWCPPIAHMRLVPRPVQRTTLVLAEDFLKESLLWDFTISCPSLFAYLYFLSSLLFLCVSVSLFFSVSFHYIHTTTSTCFCSFPVSARSGSQTSEITKLYVYFSIDPFMIFHCSSSHVGSPCFQCDLMSSIICHFFNAKCACLRYCIPIFPF